ncbi:transcription regulator isoform X2 [Wolffia australiana]
MKFLEYTPLNRFNIFLSNLNLGESIIRGSLEAYSCKNTVSDQKLSFSLEHQSSDSESPSSLGDLFRRSCRKTLIYLVLTLSHMYPDYDFSAVRAHLFFKEEEWDSFRQTFETYLFEAAECWEPLSTISFHPYHASLFWEWAIENDGSSLLDDMTKALDEVMKLDECEIYSYNPDFDGNPFLEKGAMWSFNFFFYNKKLKRVASFRCCCSSNVGSESGNAGELTDGSNEDDVIFDDMDM